MQIFRSSKQGCLSFWKVSSGSPTHLLLIFQLFAQLTWIFENRKLYKRGAIKGIGREVQHRDSTLGQKRLYRLCDMDGTLTWWKVSAWFVHKTGSWSDAWKTIMIALHFDLLNSACFNIGNLSFQCRDQWLVSVSCVKKNIIHHKSSFSVN